VTPADEAAPRRVLWLIRGLGPGGAERLLVAHARAGAADFAYEVAYQVAAKDHLVPELEAAGVVVHRLGTSPRWPLELRRLVAERGISVVHAHSPALAVGARLALRLLPGGPRPPLVYTEHNRWDAYRPATRFANALTFGLDHRCFAVSDEARSSVWGPLRSRVQTLHHGIDPVALRAAAGDPEATRHALGIDPAAPVVVHVANYRREKAHEVLLDAVRLLVDRGHDDLRVLLVGQGQRMDEVRAHLDAAHLGRHVLMLGYRPDAPALEAAADVLVLSSDHEGLPVAVMEALTLGVPVVSTRVGGVPEAITDGVEGLLVAPRDPAALADALARVLDDPELRARLGAAARARGADFDAAVPTGVIEAAYRELLARR
jgi:glycosyltransferase involved in cell wall biosynthesis